MNRPLLIRPEAEEDLATAYRWYESRRGGLGTEFLSAIHSLFERIRHTPQIHAPEYKSVRRTTASKFPYVVYYRIVQERVEVIAVLHGSRNPKTWRART